MALNIKNEEVHRLVEELARITGESQTVAVRHAVEEKLERISSRQRGRMSRLTSIAEACAAGLGEPLRSMSQSDIDAMLYDDKGMPK